MPQLWIYSAMTDRLRRTEKGWRILERRVGPTSMNNPYVSQVAGW
jgi:hypothetical protein